VGIFGRSSGREVLEEGFPVSRSKSGSWDRVIWPGVCSASALAAEIFMGDVTLFHGDGARPSSCSLLMTYYQQKEICPTTKRGAGYEELEEKV